MAVPAGLTTAGDRAVHNIIANQEESLKQLGHPSQDAKVFELLSAQGLLEQRETGIGDRKTTVKLATGDVHIDSLSDDTIESVIHQGSRDINKMPHLLEPLEGILRKVVSLGMSQDILGQGRENSLEVSALGRSHDDVLVDDNGNKERIKNMLPPISPFPRGALFGRVCSPR
jgi:hypothetical protein